MSECTKKLFLALAMEHLKLLHQLTNRLSYVTQELLSTKHLLLGKMTTGEALRK